MLKCPCTASKDMCHQMTHSWCAGCIAMRLRVYDTGVAFICAHLSSGESEGDELKRNYDYTEIIRRLQFPPDTEVAQMQQNPNAGYQPMPGITKVCLLNPTSIKVTYILFTMWLTASPCLPMLLTLCFMAWPGILGGRTGQNARQLAQQQASRS